MFPLQQLTLQHRTVTTTITQFTTDPPRATNKLMVRANTTIGAHIQNETIKPSKIPKYATRACSNAAEYSSACACWDRVAPTKTTLPRSTVTATKTVRGNVSCSPASTAAAGRGKDKAHFPCSRQWGTCSCLYSGNDPVCVRVGSFTSGRGKITKGPCEKAKECNAHGECEDKGSVCVFDDSCSCGKRRCYKAAVGGCDYQHLPFEDFMMMKAP